MTWVLLLAGCGAVSADGEPASTEVAEAPDGQVCLLPSEEGDPATAPLNVLGTALGTCSLDPATGFQRTGRCETGPADRGVHVVCARVTDEFLTFTRARGNDLSTPRPEWRFPGLRPGDGWCLCASRWREALEAGAAPPVVLEATDRGALRFVSLEALREHAVAPAEARPRP